MSYQRLDGEYPAERLILVRLEEKDYTGGAYAHIRAEVVRRVVPDLIIEEGKVATYYDGAAEKVSGYRNCSWSKNTVGAIYVADMSIRGQIDTDPKPLRNGVPYGNELCFKPYSVDLNTAKAMHDTLAKWEKFGNKHRQNHDNFLGEVLLLANFLKITKLLFPKTPRWASLEGKANYEEQTLLTGMLKITAMLAPYVKAQEQEVN